MGLIINADDFGIDPKVNEAIAEAFKREIINRTTLMTNMPYAKDAMELAKKEGFIDKVGVHLNLTAGKPLTSEMQADKVMCDEAGLFTAEFARNLKRRFFLPKTTGDNVEREVRAQLDEYKRLGGTLWHVDSHHHVHTDPSIWKELKKVIRDYPIVSVRLGRNMYRGGNPLMRLYKILLNRSIRARNQEKRDLFGSAADFKEYTRKMDEAALNDFVENHDIEVMLHPMYNDEGQLTDSGEKL